MLKPSVLFLFVAACGGKTLEPIDGGDNDGGVKKDVVIDVGPPSDAFPPPSDGAPPPLCNNIDPGSKTVPMTEVAQSAPPFAGTSSSIQPGLYELVSVTIYTGPNGSSGSSGTIAGQIRVSVANKADYIFEIGSVQDNQAPTHSNSDGNIVSPGTLTIAQTCPQPQQAVKVLYTADSSSFMIRVDGGSQTADESFAYIGP
jgi:hypothetical protein